MAIKALLAKSSQMAGGTIGNMVFQLIRNKLLALSLGPAGVGWIALVNNLVETFAVVAGGGISDSLNRELARRKPKFTAAQTFSTGLGIALLLTAIALPAVAIAAAIVVPERFPFAVLLAGLGVAVVAATAWRILAGLFLGLALAKKMVLATLAGAFANLVFTVFLLAVGVRETLAFVVLAPLCVAGAGLIAARSELVQVVNWASIRAMPARKPVLKIALPIAAGLLLEPLTALYLRSTAGLQLGDEAIGLLQPGFLFVLLSAGIFNSIAGITIVRWDQSHEPAFSAKYRLLLLVVLVAPLLATGFLFLLQPIYPFIISLIFADDFRFGASAMPWLLAGEAFRMAGALLQFTFMSRELGYICLFPRAACLATAVLAMHYVERFDIVVIGQAYALAFAVNFGLSLLLWLGLQVRLSRLSLDT